MHACRDAFEHVYGGTVQAKLNLTFPLSSTVTQRTGPLKKKYTKKGKKLKKGISFTPQDSMPDCSWQRNDTPME